jgi:hypothetical protein
MKKDPKVTGWYTKSMGVGVANLYNQGFYLDITHVPTGHQVEFPAFITDQSDAYTSNWTEETVFGRMDPIATFESTKRVATLGFTVPSRSRHDALHNLGKLNTLISFLYPTYSSVPGSTVMNMGPLVRVKYANLICSTENPAQGLLGYITTGITITPNIEAGVLARASGSPAEEPSSAEISQQINQGIGSPQDRDLIMKGSGIVGPEILYKAYDLNFELSVLHEHSLGFEKRLVKGKETYVFRNESGKFPYNTGHHTTPHQILNRGQSEALAPLQGTPAPPDVGSQTQEERSDYLAYIQNNEQLKAYVSKILSSNGTDLETASDAMLSDAIKQYENQS